MAREPSRSAPSGPSLPDMADTPRYWFNIRTGQVQTDDDKGQGKNLMGPYPTAKEAARALISAAERTRRLDEEERLRREESE